MTVTLSPPMFLEFFVPNNSGVPAAGYKLFTYIAGTSTKQATWTDSSQSVQNANPLILDSNGIGTLWGDPSLAFKFVWAAANDTDPPTSPIRTVDNLTFPPSLALVTSNLRTLIWPVNEVAFTPSIAFATSGSITQTVIGASYSQVGNVLTFSFRIGWSAIASPTGNVLINGMPVAAKSGGPDAVCTILTSGISFSAGYLAFFIGNGANFGSIFNMQASGTTGQVGGAAFSSTGYLIVSGSYQV